jgi:hypothetical protein
MIVNDPATYVQALAATGDVLSGNARQSWLGSSSSAPAYVIESAEGIVTYPGFGKDAASKKARKWLTKRLAAYEHVDHGAQDHQ